MSLMDAAEASERFNNSKTFDSLRSIKKAINDRLSNNEIVAFARGIAAMPLYGKVRFTDHEGEDAIATLDELIEKARAIFADYEEKD
jgi:hypothetical protein